MNESSFASRNLQMQGFQEPCDLQRLDRALRFTPALSALWITSGVLLGSPLVLLSFALASAFGATQRKHPFDHLYEAGGRRLPDNPAPRRFAMALAAAWATGAAALFASERRRAGRIAGGLLSLAGASVAATHFCLGSWIFGVLGRAPRLDRRAQV